MIFSGQSVVIQKHHVVPNWGLPTTASFIPIAPQSLLAACNGAEAMPEFDWRSPDSYKSLLDAEITDIASECLRRNADYRRDFEAMIANSPDVEVTQEFRRKWGLCFRP
ncbi:hypothetical protein M2427_007516 [Bradyrhizobium sp. BR13661]|jgi:hypothetical protein|nr:hypothetical protein [Bradyrhizobium sp. BR13661]